MNLVGVLGKHFSITSGFNILWPMMYQSVILFLSLLFVVPTMNQSLVPCWSCTGQKKTCATKDPSGVCTNFVTISWWILKSCHLIISRHQNGANPLLICTRFLKNLFWKINFNELDFYCLCSLLKSISKLIFAG